MVWKSFKMLSFLTQNCRQTEWVIVAQSCLTHATPWTVARQAPLSMRILQARLLEWVAISFLKATWELLTSLEKSRSLQGHQENQADSLPQWKDLHPQLLVRLPWAYPRSPIIAFSWRAVIPEVTPPFQKQPASCDWSVRKDKGVVGSPPTWNNLEKKHQKIRWDLVTSSKPKAVLPSTGASDWLDLLHTNFSVWSPWNFTSNTCPVHLKLQIFKIWIVCILFHRYPNNWSLMKSVMNNWETGFCNIFQGNFLKTLSKS